MEANVHAMGGTLAYSVNFDNIDNSHYDLEVLTVATHLDGNTNMIDS